MSYAHVQDIAIEKKEIHSPKHVPMVFTEEEAKEQVRKKEQSGWLLVPVTGYPSRRGTVQLWRFCQSQWLSPQRLP
jgi:hypothetical protein